MTYKELKREAFEANMQLPELGLVLFTFGNVSAADHAAGVLAIKPSGVPYKDLKAEDMVVVDFDAQHVEGSLRPSSDTKTHAFLYKNWPSVKGITHTHSTYAVAWAQAGLAIPIMGTTHADYSHLSVPCAPYLTSSEIEKDYELASGKQIIDKMGDVSPTELEMILLHGHGPFTWGKSAEKSVHNAAVLEKIAKMAFLTLQINPSAGLLPKDLINKHYQRKHGKDAYYGQGC